MTIQMEYCMPPIQYTNVGWLSEIWQGRKKVSIKKSLLKKISIQQAIKNKDAIQTACPHIDGTRVQDLLGFLQKNKFDDYLPGLNSKGKPLKYDRNWLLIVSTFLHNLLSFNQLCMTLATSAFKKFRE